MKESKVENLHQQQTTKNNADHLESNFSLTPPDLNFSTSANPAQLAPEEEEEAMQAKMNPAQLMEEEEEIAQPKLKTSQLMEEEEEMAQPKLKTSQLMEEEEEMAQYKLKTSQLSPDEEEESMQTKMAPSQQTSQPGQETHSSTKMPDQVQSKMEASLGADFSDVSIHKDSSKATDVGALAYAQGSDVHFAPGQFKPDSHTGQELLGHELTHIVQQREGRVSANIQKKGMSINNDPGLENEADRLGKKAANHKEK